MVEFITNKPASEIRLEPLDPNEGPGIILYGLQRERGGFSANNPTRRVLSGALLSQGRPVGPRRYTLPFAIFEPVTNTDGSSRPDFSGVQPADVVTPLSVRDQMDTLRALAKLSERGIHLRYRGITVHLDRCVIVDVQQDTQNVFGDGTLTIEERPDDPRDLTGIVLTFEEIEQAIRDAGDAPVSENTDSLLTALANGNLTEEQYRDLIRQFMAQTLHEDAGPIYIPQKADSRAGLHFGLGCLPLHTVDDRGEVRQILPSDPNGATPVAKVIPLADVFSRAGALNSQFIRSDPITQALGLVPGTVELIVAAAGLFFLFVFRNEADRTWSVEVRVYDKVGAAYADTRQNTKSQTDSHCPPPNARAIRTETNANDPLYVTPLSRVSYGQEVPLAAGNLITFCFVGPDGRNPFRDRGIRIKELGQTLFASPDPLGAEIGQFGLVLADYRSES